ncbi:MAG: Crp/Fnr family transcriptional regulator [Candidatus Izemoplasmatales bacterium]|nr:Crp/Fnr family transcriptional regulator [Candidatus Izemoplasmatales bacterium]
MKIDYSHHVLLDKIPIEMIPIIDAKASIRCVPAGSFIHLEDERCDALELIVEGQVHVEPSDRFGKEKIITTYGKGDVVGLNILFSSESVYPMNIISDTQSWIYSLPKSMVIHLLETNNHFCHSFLRILSDNSTQLGRAVKDEFSKTLREKIIDYMDKNAKTDDTSIHFHTSKTNLAKLFGVARTSLSRELQKMRQEGLIEYDRNTIRFR